MSRTGLWGKTWISFVLLLCVCASFNLGPGHYQPERATRLVFPRTRIPRFANSCFVPLAFSNPEELLRTGIAAASLLLPSFCILCVFFVLAVPPLLPFPFLVPALVLLINASFLSGLLESGRATKDGMCTFFSSSSCFLGAGNTTTWSQSLKNGQHELRVEKLRSFTFSQSGTPTPNLTASQSRLSCVCFFFLSFFLSFFALS